MKHEEQDYLKQMHKGMGIQAAYKRIKYLKDSQTDFKSLSKEIKKRDTKIKNLELTIKKLRDQISNLKNKNAEVKIAKANSRLGKDMFRKVVEEEQLNKHRVLINRIQKNLEMGRTYTKTDMKKDFMVNYKKVDWCLQYLLSKGIIGMKLVNGFEHYYKLGESD